MISRLGFLGSLLGLAWDPCADLKRRIRARVELGVHEDNCGGANDYANGYRKGFRDFQGWLDRGMPEGFDER